jgi:hypothetical protein
MCGRGPDVQGDWIDKGKPVARRGRKATGLTEVSQPGYRIRGKEVARTMRIKSLLTHSLQAIAEGSLIALLVVGLMAGSVFAGGKGGGGGKPGGGGSTSSLAVVMVADANANGQPNYGDQITFNVVRSSAQQFVGLRCWQGSNFVFDSYVGYFDGAWFGDRFTLGSMYWDASLSASCTARLFTYSNRGTERVSATTTFAVAP